MTAKTGVCRDPDHWRDWYAEGWEAGVAYALGEVQNQATTWPADADPRMALLVIVGRVRATILNHAKAMR